jgi:hypothetical protein
MESSTPVALSVRERIGKETREFAVIAAYLYICFAALVYLKAAILHAYGIPFEPFGLAAVKALICAKFVLVGRMFGLGDRFKTRPLIWPTLYQSFAFLVLLLVLDALEEIIVGLVHHRTLADSLAELGGGTLYQLIAMSFIVFLMLIPFFAFRVLGEVVGERNLVRVFFVPRRVAAKG